jgi:hypothetical protein
MAQTAAGMNSLQMVLTVRVILLFVLFYRVSIRQVGFSINESGDAYHVSVGSHPFLLGWSIIAVFLFLAINAYRM